MLSVPLPLLPLPAAVDRGGEESAFRLLLACCSGAEDVVDDDVVFDVADSACVRGRSGSMGLCLGCVYAKASCGVRP